ncbi:putative tyrosine--tRNA ligase [Rosa chinensis]|uniref:tyrosine--tRNA ligase n=1 Tax=Rosa chinensis TaxID=74649 RepID=A0A2P6PS65_ROSCH|nr:tyrosine--tRNA ligase 1, cytoplasmic [Rosa chinensis]PRQ24756.1 putative tyrosine--tRNA ligase [Rosa chinensis]
MATKLAPEQVIPSDEIKSMSISDAPEDQQMTVAERCKLILTVGEQCTKEDELRNLLERKPEPIAYDGFEPSGRMHIAQGVMKAINVNKLTKAGCRVKILIADWFAKMNNKMGGDMQKIETVGHYFIEVWKSIGMDLEKVEFVWSSKEINSRAHEYLPLVMDIAGRNSIERMKRCTQIMGREAGDNMPLAQAMYPCMQCADVFFLKADICQMGTDQRKVNMLAREYCNQIQKKDKPVILSHRMLPGLKEGQNKMSKSDESSAIFMEDDEAQVNLKIKKAHCVPGEVKGNPCLEYVQHLIFPWFNEFVVERSEKNGGDITFTNFEQLSNAYASGQLHPGDLKPALAKSLNKMLEPVRSHFKNDPTAKQLLRSVKSFRVTR